MIGLFFLFREPGITGKGLYKLKNEYLLSCNPYFMHFRKTERCKVMIIFILFLPLVHPQIQKQIS